MRRFRLIGVSTFGMGKPPKGGPNLVAQGLPYGRLVLHWHGYRNTPIARAHCYRGFAIGLSASYSALNATGLLSAPVKVIFIERQKCGIRGRGKFVAASVGIQRTRFQRIDDNYLGTN